MTSEMASALDDVRAIERRDPGGMLRHIAEWPQMLRAGWGLTRKLSLPEAHRSAPAAAVLGMGGSAIAGDLVRAIFSDRLSIPLVSVRGYDLPAWADRQSLVIAVSHSGTTEETVSSLSAALSRRANVAVITTGGALGDVAKRVELPLLTYPDQTPPRAALGYTLPMLAGLLERAGFLVAGDAEIEAAAEAVSDVIRDCGPDRPTESNPAKQLAWSLIDRLPIIEAGGFLSAVAYRWKTQMNENGKVPAWHSTMSELDHNEVVGWTEPFGATHAIVALRSAHEHPELAARFALSADIATEAGVEVREVWAPELGPLASLLSLVHVGDFTSCYVGLARGFDPTPVDVISGLKAALAAMDV